MQEEGKCRLLIRSEFKDGPNYTNVWIMGEPFLKAYYSVYSLNEAHFGLIRIADATRSRYTMADTSKHNTKCSDQEAALEAFKGRIEKCGTIPANCYDPRTDKYSNDLCVSKHESCATFVYKGSFKMGCILSQHCKKIGSYKD